VLGLKSKKIITRRSLYKWISERWISGQDYLQLQRILF
jgi:hypothetical protein